MKNASSPWILIPIKRTKNAKQRLARILSLDERSMLVKIMLMDVLAALTERRGIAGIAVVTGDSTIKRLADSWRIRTIHDGEDSGMADAVNNAARILHEEGIRAVAILPGDVPLTTRSDVEVLLDAHAKGDGVVVVPAAYDGGSNALVLSPATLMPTMFGKKSADLHIAGARKLGIEPVIVQLAGMGRDIDRAEDLLAVLQSPDETRTRQFLTQIEFSRRLVGTREHAV